MRVGPVLSDDVTSLPAVISLYNLLELLVQPVLLYLEGDLSGICGVVEVVLPQHHQHVLVNNPAAGECHYNHCQSCLWSGIIHSSLLINRHFATK